MFIHWGDSAWVLLYLDDCTRVLACGVLAFGCLYVGVYVWVFACGGVCCEMFVFRSLSLCGCFCARVTVSILCTCLSTSKF